MGTVQRLDKRLSALETWAKSQSEGAETLDRETPPEVRATRPTKDRTEPETEPETETEPEPESEPESETETETESETEPETGTETATVDLENIDASGFSDDAAASAEAHAILDHVGIDPADVDGSGEGGRVLKSDAIEFVKSQGLL